MTFYHLICAMFDRDRFSAAFPGFTNALTDRLFRDGRRVTFGEGDMVMRPGQFITNALVILSGRIKVYREGDEGEEFFLYYLEPGTACALSMICAARQEASVLMARADTDVEALAIPVEHLEGLMRGFPDWYTFVMETYRNRFEEMMTVLDQVVFHSMDEKLEFYLKRQFSVHGDRIQVTHQQIATDLNSSREVISRLLKKMENSRMIDIGRNELVRGPDLR